MNIYLKKRKKSVFNSYKTVRASISLNNINGQLTEYAWQEAMVVNNWENNWIEQVTEVKSELNPVNQTVFKQNKLITKWWENN
jgi:hypothetical protein